ncbi:alpha/beta hydrolase [Planobispora rosea]|uniref:Alpha/beta hydrolase n=1 Tax=Planobispora rosea TaxID=35762 RepID=A0A8J3S947_PLARO|nr:alpha/beta hydrolase [Planobispora rosea]GGT01450.1 alpha/beta hydrolase [Planobispora rosea]GIH88347.1 alpha/beta hydrolase [Planobispora rosea]
MATFVLIHGGGGVAWQWHLLDPELRARGHEVVAVDLPLADEKAGLAELADAVVEAVGGRTDVVVVAHSWGGFVGPLVCDRLGARLLVMLAAMIPAPGEPPGDWWAATGFEGPGDDSAAAFCHDLPPALAEEAMRRTQDHAERSLVEPWPLTTWPDVPTKVLICGDDRFFRPEFMRRIARERLGAAPEEIGGSHMVMLSRPEELAARLDGYVRP